MNKIIENEDNNSQGSNKTLTSNSDNVNENNKRCKKSIIKNRSTKKELYQREREEFIKGINKILKIDDNNNYIYKYEIETNKEFENYIKENMGQIRKMWKTGLWGYFSDKKEQGKDNIIGLYRTLLNDSDYLLFSKQKIITINGKKERKTIYYIEKKNINL
jgi:hypothetical protein